MPAVSLTDYTSAQAEIARRQKLADALSEQGQQEIPIQSYQGTQAAIPWTAVLAKALQSTAGAYISHKASDDAEKLRKTQADAEDKAATSFNNIGNVATTAPVNPAPQMGNDDYAAMAAAPKGPNPQNLAAALGSDPTATPPPQGPSPQAMGAALGGQPPPQAPPPQPMPAGPPAAPVAPPQAAPAPAAVAPVPGSIEARRAEAQARFAAAMQMRRQFGDTYAAPYLKTAQEQMAKIQDLQDAAAEKASAHAEDIQSATKLVTALPGLDEGTRALLGPVAAIGGMKALEPALTKLMDNKLGPHDTYMSPQEMQQHGFGPGSIVQVNSVTGDTKILVDGTKVAQENTRIGLERQNVGLSGARLNLERQRFSAERSDKANAVFDPATIQQMAMQARQGDTSVFQNLGRGVQGAQNMVALRRAIFDPALGPMTGAQMAQINANFKGVQSEQRAIGNRAGQAAVGASEVPILARQADTAYSQLSRTDLVPYNQLKRMVESGTSNPAQRAAFVADNAAVIARARALSPTGQPHLADIKAGEGMLNDAIGPEAHRAVLNQFILEAGGMKQGAANAMGNGPTNMAPIGAAHAPYPDPAKEARYQAWLKSHGG